MTQPGPAQNSAADETYEGVVQDMRDLYDNRISDQEAHEAARNLIRFGRLALEIKSASRQNPAHVKHN